MRIQKGKTPSIGTRAQVWHKTAKHTSGGLEEKICFKHLVVTLCQERNILVIKIAII